MTFRYIGSKARIAEDIATYIGSPQPGERFVDLFCGTGAVAAEAAKRGWNLLLNDHLYGAVTVAAARLTSVEAARFAQLGGYLTAIQQLNELPPERGFIWREYTPASKNRVGFERRYFTEANGGRIDAIRRRIQQWTEDGYLDEIEERLLVADLLGAANRVANIAGTYGCFLSGWQANAVSTLELRPRLLLTDHVDVEVSVMDAFAVKTKTDDLVYVDPPYTKRQYAAYYHLVETITLGDEPEVSGVTGLRPWQHKASPFCYKAKARDAFVRLVQGISAERLLISYSDEGHVPMGELVSALGKAGAVRARRFETIGRYRPNQVARAGRDGVNEYLLEVSRAAELAAA